ncbi:hypothetical protein NX059_008201 [Plenodomus lindquistii]|nr:hypothetical protein NX059_008201 [Plenodomus lindquistii]
MGEHIIVIGRMSSNKGSYSLEKGGKRVQLEQDAKTNERREEGRTIAKRLGRNAHDRIRWVSIESTWHKKGSADQCDWQSNRKNQAAMAMDIKAWLKGFEAGTEVTICIRSLDGLTLNEEALQSFVEYVVKDCKLEALIVWQILVFANPLDHRRMTPFKGLGSVIAFTANELHAYFTTGTDSSVMGFKTLLGIMPSFRDAT